MRNLLYRHWNINPVNKALAGDLAAECGVSPFIALIAAGRGYTDPACLDEFLSDECLMCDPYELRGIEKAADIINDAIYSEEKIAVFGDYDVDGITATAIMYGYLKERGANVIYLIPDREKDGYGISISAIDRLKSENVDLIITVDNGISAANEVNYAKSLGMKVVVCDHHLPPEDLPEADAVVDPHLPDDCSEFKDVCGAFVAFKVVCVTEGSSPEEMLCRYADLVALGTVADIMPLTYENRTVVREGVAMMSTGSNRGLSALIRAAGLTDAELTASRLAFGLAPRLNAAGRMGDAARALQLLLTDDDETAHTLAELLNNENIRRQTLEKKIFEEAVLTVEKKGYKHNRIIVVSGENWHGGVVGIVAARLVEKYGRPAVVLSVNEGVANGSARSIKGLSIYDALCDCSHLLERFGGHEMAAGLTLNTCAIDAFRNRINEYARGFERKFPELTLDCKLNPAALSVDLAEELSQLEPFGAGNPVPLFGLFGLTLTKISAVGGGKHLRLSLSKGDVSFTAMMFSVSEPLFPYSVGDCLDLAVTIGTNFYGGTTSLTISVKDIRKSNINEEDFFEDICSYEDFKSGVIADYSRITPTRQDVGIIYKQLLSSAASLDKISVMASDTLGMAKSLIAAEALCELRVCSVFEADSVPMIKVTDKNTKVNLSDAPILRKLGGETYDSQP